jgi:hypothetical protein
VCSPDVVDHCQPGLRCVGNCIPLGREGETCDEESDGLVCEAGLLCLDGHCGHLSAIGEACDDELPCEPCARCEDGICEPSTTCGGVDEAECGFGARCRRGECRALAALDEACDVVQCEPDLVCLVATLRCTRPPAVLEPCVSTVEAGTSCGRDLRCAAGTCAAWPGPGEACSGRCASGLSCLASVCVPHAELGETCDPSGSTAPICAFGTYCTPTRTCIAQSADGAFCNDPVECIGGFCDEHACRGLPGEDERCLAGLCGAGLLCSIADVCVTGEGAGCLEPCGIGLVCSRRFECGW